MEARPEIDMTPQSPMERRQSEEGRARAEYGERRQAYSLSVHDQEPAIPRVINTAISWDQAHGVRPIDSLKQERKAAETELAEIGDGHPEKLGDFTVGDKEKAGAAPDGEQTQETSVLEREALNDGLTLVPEDDASAGSSSLVNRGLSQDGAWEAREGLKPVSTKRRVVSSDESEHEQRAARSDEHEQRAARSMLRSQGVHGGLVQDSKWESDEGLKPVSSRRTESRAQEQLQRRASTMLRARDELKDTEGKSDEWERRHQMIPDIGLEQERMRARSSDAQEEAPADKAEEQQHVQEQEQPVAARTPAADETALLKEHELASEAWERRQKLIPFPSHKQDRIPSLADAEVPVNGAQEEQPGASSELVVKADEEAEQVGSAGIKALGFGDAKDFEKHLEKEGI